MATFFFYGFHCFITFFVADTIMRKMKFLKVTFKRGGGGCVTEYQADKQYDAYRHLANIHNYYFQCTFGTTTAHQYQLGHRPHTRGRSSQCCVIQWSLKISLKCIKQTQMRAGFASYPTSDSGVDVVLLPWTPPQHHPPPPISEYSLSLRCQKCCLLSNIAHCCRITKRDYLNGPPAEF